MGFEIVFDNSDLLLESIQDDSDSRVSFCCFKFDYLLFVDLMSSPY